MFIKTIELDMKQFNNYLLTIVDKSYRELIGEIKKYISVITLIDILGISQSTHNRWLKEDLASLSIKLHLELLIKSYKELNI